MSVFKFFGRQSTLYRVVEEIVAMAVIVGEDGDASCLLLLVVEALDVEKVVELCVVGL